VGLSERAYEVAGLNPVSSEGLFLPPNAQYSSAQVTPPSATLLNGSASGSSVKQGYWRFFSIQIPSGAPSLTVKTTNATADVDLYVRSGVLPTESSFACRPFLSSGNETCTIFSPAAGVWGIGVRGHSSGTPSFSVTAVADSTA